MPVSTKINHLVTRTFFVMLLSIAGALLGASIYFFGTPSTPESQAFIVLPEFITWFFINELLFALYPIVALLLWKPIKQLGKYLLHNKLEIFISSFILFALFIFPTVTAANIIKFKPAPLEYADTKILIIETVGFVASTLPVAIGFWLVHIAIRDIPRDINPLEIRVKEYIRFRDYLQQFLIILGVLLSLLILASAALRKAAIASGVTTTDDYPSIYLLLAGAYYTLLVAIIYFPVYTALISTGYQLLDAYFPLLAPDSKSWGDTYPRRKELEDLLELKIAGEQRFLTNITLLGPFVSSIFTLLVGT